ncbi:methyl-accepting chemotaxis protein [Pseudooceanicola atlanticus]|uniref:methyl-accepting chemotaxis protein n=1 Tax=Pseudooceanicola atlanticus TaxID=1461694 RepID=UPI0006950B1D|nr:methyl-accepting chemotaxis protein [Pseudooceanicola atlanticus]
MTTPLTGNQVQSSEGLRRLSPFYWFGNLRLAVKLPMIIVVLGGLVAVVLTATSYFDSRAIMLDEIKSKFYSTLESRRNQVVALFEATEQDILLQADNPTTLNALTSFSLAWRTIGDGQKETLQSNYISDNPMPSGQKDAYVATNDGSQYDVAHQKFHGYFRKLLKARGYYDIMLVDADGNVVYSVFKEIDFATNLMDGEWRTTDLANAFRTAKTLKSGEVTFFDFRPYAPSNNAPASFMATPLIKNGEVKGALIIQTPTTRLNKIAQSSYGLGQTGEAILLGSDFLARSASRFDGSHGLLSPIERRSYREAAFAGEDPGFVTSRDENGNVQHAMIDVFSIQNAQWAVEVVQNDAELLAPVIDLRNMLLMQLAGLMVVLAIIGALVGRSVSKPFIKVATRLRSMADGNLSSPIPHTDRREDAGDLARNLENLRGKLETAEVERRRNDAKAQQQQIVVDHLTASIGELAQGNLTARIDTVFDDDYEALREAFNAALAKLNETVTSLLMAAQEIDDNARDVETASNDLSQKAIEQAASLEETAAAITELSASVKSTADAAGEADKIMGHAKDDAKESNDVVNRAMKAMDRISTSSQKISQVTSVIEDLAFQTNLLALNAGVEAARAGEAGRGFAVVASEVRALAQRSSEAAKEINSLIKESSDNVVDGVELVEKAGASFESLIGDFDKVSASVSSIAAAAREQSIGLEEINTAVDQLDGVTQKNAAVATQVHGTGKTMVNEAAKLMQVSSAFHVDRSHVPQSAAVPAPQPARQRAVVNAPVARIDDVADEEWSEF